MGVILYTFLEGSGFSGSKIALLHRKVLRLGAQVHYLAHIPDAGGEPTSWGATDTIDLDTLEKRFIDFTLFYSLGGLAPVIHPCHEKRSAHTHEPMGSWPPPESALSSVPLIARPDH